MKFKPNAALLSIVTACCSLSMFTSCSDTKNTPVELSAQDTLSESVVPSTEELPSPLEMALVIKESGAKYNNTFPNSIQNISKYATYAQKATNLGVYCSDVGYSTLFKQTQENMFFLNNCRKLSDEIGLTAAFDQSVFDRIEANIDKRDSLLGIITETYGIANSFLKSNGRYGTFLLMMAGGWIESNWIACNMALETPSNQEIIDRIDAQRLPLQKIIKSMQPFLKEKEVAEMHGLLSQIETSYESNAFINRDEELVSVNKSAFSKHVEIVKAVRNKITLN